MSLRLRIVLAVIVLLTFAIFISQVKKNKLMLQYTMSWMILLLIILVVTIFPEILTGLSNLLGVSLPINMVFFLGFCFTLLIVYNLTKAVSEQSEQIKNLTQKIALLEDHVNKLEEKQHKGE